MDVMRPGAVVLLFVLAAGCGKPLGGPELTAIDYKLFEAVGAPNGGAIAVVDSQSHMAGRTLPLGTPNSDWTHLYTVNGLKLMDIDPQTGATLHSLNLDRDYQLPQATLSGLPGGLSINGRHLALEGWDRTSSTPNNTHMLVVDTSFNSAPVRIDLAGWFEFDAISDDGQRLYLIEYLAPGKYRVREYMVGGRYLDPNVITDKSDPKDSMTGLRLSGVASPDGQFLYSIYVRQNDGAFIHALPLSGMPTTFCIDIPSPGYQDNPDAMGWAVVMSPGGAAVYAINAALGIASEISVSQESVIRTVHFTPSAFSAASLVTNAEAKELGGAAVISPDGKTLVASGARGLVWLDTNTLQVRDRALTDWRVTGLAASPDGKLLYAVSDGGMFAELSFGSAKTGTVFDAGALGYPITLMRVAST
jgi:hypothetical protein